MLHLFRTKKELSEEMALDRTFEIVNLRECLKLLREKKTQAAIDCMEIHLDVVVLALSRCLDSCKVTTRSLIEGEIKKLSLYRKEGPGRSESWLDGCDSTTRDGLLRTRAEAAKVLDRFTVPEK